ncbi:MAG: ferritin-like domain-containing protein [Polyangiaceae bacterium]
MQPREVVRRSLFASLGLLATGCSADGRTSAGGEVVIPTPSNTAPVASASPSSSARTPVKVPGAGYVTESDGTIHRAGPATCDATIDAPSCKGTEKMLDCKTDADCKEHPHGKCTSYVAPFRPGTDGCTCQYACATDSDCGGKDEVCVCKDAANRIPHAECAVAKCKSDDECPSVKGKGGVCGLSSYFNGCGNEVTLACRTAKDACQTTSDCKDGETCAVREDTWMCQGMSCAIGRPLTVGDGWARAAACDREDWSSEDIGEPCLDGESLARWMEVAALEHASVASFARFSLQLLALGAPAELARAAQEAALDEIAHARLAYAIASRIAGRPIGPTELPEARMDVALDVRSVVRALVLEACAGETVGAIEALEARDAASDPALRAIFDRIAKDELRHAELAFRALGWLVRAHGEPARGAALSALASARLPGRERDVADVVRPAIDAVVRA